MKQFHCNKNNKSLPFNKIFKQTKCSCGRELQQQQQDTTLENGE